MGRIKKVDSKEVGLDIGLNLFGFFFESEYMHYGYWPEGLEVIAPNFKQAQENHTRFLVSHIPTGVHSILDVGCGSGKVTEELAAQGFRMAAVSPPSNLTRRAATRLDGHAPVTQARFEDYTGTGPFDMILFSESYQYVDLAAGFRQAARLLRPGGYILLFDFFRTDAEGLSPLGGGHDLREFYASIPTDEFSIRTDLDITAQIAPTMTLINRLMLEVVKPSGELLVGLAEDRYPWIYRLVKWQYQKRIQKKLYQHFEGRRTAENFIKYKSYRLILLQKTDAPTR
jgi:SAM-dependent methyltransferase